MTLEALKTVEADIESIQETAKARGQQVDETLLACLLARSIRLTDRAVRLGYIGEEE